MEDDMTTNPVPHEIIPCDRLPAGQYRDLPEPPHWRKLVGPSILLLGLSLGSGEFVLWPYLESRAWERLTSRASRGD